MVFETEEVYIGVDPGCPLTVAVYAPGAPSLHILEGEMIAVQVRKGKGKRWENEPVLLAAGLRDLLRRFEGWYVVAAVERAATRPGQGAASQARYIQSEGLALGVLAGLGVYTIRATPSAWKREMRLSADKELSRQRAITELPAYSTMFARKKDHNRAEALLLALWLRKHEGRGDLTHG
jgi:crossover junction endodeoxyribonuclease RuvC